MNKKRLKQLLYGSEIRCLGVISNGLVHKVPKRIVLRELRKEIKYIGYIASLRANEMEALWKEKVGLYNKISRETFSNLKKSDLNYLDELEARRSIVYRASRRVFSQLEHTKNVVADAVEKRVKESEINNIKHSDSVFFVCNGFDDCAKDHLDYQFRIYVSDSYSGGDDRIDAYIRNHAVLTVREVTENKPYLLTRPNCRHKLFPIDTEEVLSSSVNKIIKRHKLAAKHENEYNCVLTPAKVSYIGYYERLKALLMLKKMCPSKELNEDIKKTRLLVVKWKREV